MKAETTKAVLVIDMPNNCEECKIIYLQWYGERSTCESGDWSKRPSWCPLRPLPQKKEPNEEWLNKYHRDEFADGWNECIEELLNTGLNYSKEGEELENERTNFL